MEDINRAVKENLVRHTTVADDITPTMLAVMRENNEVIVEYRWLFSAPLK
jgi:hypothetical protein